MAQAVLMPKIGISVESCIITSWHKNPGDTIAEGDILFDYETDKSSLECESTASGILLERFFEDGDEVPVLVAVCAVGEKGEDVSHLRPSTGDEKEEQKQVPVATQDAPSTKGALQEQASQERVMQVPAEDIKISPRARRLAEKHNLNPGFATASGPYGRIIERDVRAAIEQGVGLATGAATADAPYGTGIGGRVSTADMGAGMADEAILADAPEYEDIAFSGIRRAISKSMAHSLSTIPQLTHNFTFNADAILEYRALIKENGEAMGLPNITLNDLMLYAVSRILPRYPQLNAHMLDGTTIRQYKDVNLGVAVDTPRGLMVPNIKAANRKSLSQISTEAKTLIEQAQEGSISPDYLQGGTFTVTNLGTLNVESFTPVINPPETGILGVNNIIRRPIEKDGGVAFYSAMGISLTYDHRAIDGAPASRFASELCRSLENIALLLAL